MDWGVGPSGRERFAQALLTFMFFASAPAALAALGPVRIFSGHPDLQGRTAPDIGLGAMESAPRPSAD